MNDSHDGTRPQTESRDTIRGKIREFLLSAFYVPDTSRLCDDASLLEAGVVDSTGVLEVLGFLAREFEIRVEDSEITPENLDSIDRLAGFVSQKLKEGRSELKAPASSTDAPKS